MPDSESERNDHTQIARQTSQAEPYRHIPIIAMTAHALTGDRERCLQAGMDNYISKPVTAHALLDLVAEYGVKPTPAP
jgi:CheY-like chemotaxis protein